MSDLRSTESSEDLAGKQTDSHGTGCCGAQAAPAPARGNRALGAAGRGEALAPSRASHDEVRETVRAGYTVVAERSDGSCCGAAAEASRRIGYGDEELAAVPEGANLGVGCGNPTAIDALAEGEVVVDLGSGAGMDAFLAARRVGPTGRVIGIDMTDAMLAKARENASKGGFTNVEFRKGMIEELPIESESVDVILSNCVINLSPEKDRVYREAYRVLRPGGRVMVSDVVLERELPAVVRDSVAAYVGCIGGASVRDVYLDTVRAAGFSEVRVVSESNFGAAVSLEDPTIREAIDALGITPEEARGYLEGVRSVQLFARK